MACAGGQGFISAPAVDAGAGDVVRLDQVDAGDVMMAVLEHDGGHDAGQQDGPDSPAFVDAGDAMALVLEHDASVEAGPVDARANDDGWELDSGDEPYDAGPDVVDAGDVDARDAYAGPCDPAYGDASPGGPCCVHVWATPTMGAVLCTVDGSRWCWQTDAMLCSVSGSKCVVQYGVSYCAP